MLRLGLIGVGHGSTLMQVNSPEHDDVPMRVTAVCDVNEDRMAAAAASTASPGRPPTSASSSRATT